jgi:hypothetical protein
MLVAYATKHGTTAHARERSKLGNLDFLVGDEFQQCGLAVLRPSARSALYGACPRARWGPLQSASKSLLTLYPPSDEASPPCCD